MIRSLFLALLLAGCAVATAPLVVVETVTLEVPPAALGMLAP